ncbi:MAG TPA: ribosome maturation factor RimP [Dissulfurispiraceae bacterium]|nr:ribosome maturation factor RimP [Dissulfurispiraceae bacterium]
MIRDAGIKDKIQELALQVTEDEQVELVDVIVLGSGRKTLVRLTIDKDGGVTVGDCEKVSRGVEALLDVEDVIANTYMLEVSSPGLDRPLTKMRDFERSVGKLARIITAEKIGDESFFIGRIIDTGDNFIRLRLEDKPAKGARKKKLPEEPRDVFIPIEKISKAKLEIEP